MNNILSQQPNIRYFREDEAQGHGLAPAGPVGSLGGSYVSSGAANLRVEGQYVTSNAPRPARPGSYVTTSAKPSGPVGRYTASAN